MLRLIWVFVLAMIGAVDVAAQGQGPWFFIANGEPFEIITRQLGAVAGTAKAPELVVEIIRSLNPQLEDSTIVPTLPTGELIVVPDDASLSLRARPPFLWMTCRHLDGLIARANVLRTGELRNALQSLAAEHRDMVRGRDHTHVFHIWIIPIQADSEMLLIPPSIPDGFLAQKQFGVEARSQLRDLLSDEWRALMSRVH